MSVLSVVIWFCRLFGFGTLRLHLVYVRYLALSDGLVLVLVWFTCCGCALVFSGLSVVCGLVVLFVCWLLWLLYGLLLVYYVWCLFVTLL